MIFMEEKLFVIGGRDQHGIFVGKNRSLNVISGQWELKSPLKIPRMYAFLHTSHIF